MIQQTNFATLVPSDQKAIADFATDCKLRNMTRETIQGYECRLRISSKILQQKGLSICGLDNSSLSLILSELRAKNFNGKPFSSSNIKHYFSSLSSFADYLVWSELSLRNVVRPFVKRYLRELKTQLPAERKLISIEEMSMLINSVLDPRAKAILTLFAKTGIRRNELIQIDLDEINWVEQSILLKPHPKRTNRLVFFDDETSRVLKRWIKARQNYEIETGCNALFVNEQSQRLRRHGVERIVTKYARLVGLHNSNSKKMEDHLTPHCFRHWFTTYLRRNGMSRELIQELRGDSRNETIDIYDHIDKKELKRAYLAAIPILGIE